MIALLIFLRSKPTGTSHWAFTAFSQMCTNMKSEDPLVRPASHPSHIAKWQAVHINTYHWWNWDFLQQPPTNVGHSPWRLSPWNFSPGSQQASFHGGCNTYQIQTSANTAFKCHTLKLWCKIAFSVTSQTWVFCLSLKFSIDVVKKTSRWTSRPSTLSSPADVPKATRLFKASCLPRSSPRQ